MTVHETYNSVWDAISDTPEQAANLRARAELMQQIVALIEASGWKQTEAAKHCGITQPRVSDLLRGRVSRFSLDALVNIATALGQRVHLALKATGSARAAAVLRTHLQPVGTRSRAIPFSPLGHDGEPLPRGWRTASGNGGAARVTG
jgi:predicted XRE-type DNA-binding protein